MRKTNRRRSPMDRLRSRGIIAILAALFLASTTTPVQAWGPAGHRICGKIAEARLTPKAREEVRKLLDSGESLADASTWADENRAANPGSETWHYVNVPINEASAYDHKKYDQADRAVVAQIRKWRELLANEKLPRVSRLKALRYLVHFVEDVHQPLHVGDNNDRGGNQLQLTFYEQGSNLHRVWDSGILSKMGRDEDRHVARITSKITPDLEKLWIVGGPEDWATESLLLAKKAYLDPKTGKPLRRGDRLDRSYVDAHQGDVDLQLMKAGVRLANMLNETFK